MRAIGKFTVMCAISILFALVAGIIVRAFPGYDQYVYTVNGTLLGAAFYELGFITTSMDWHHET